jgi:hypothetical protein
MWQPLHSAFHLALATAGMACLLLSLNPPLASKALVALILVINTKNCSHFFMVLSLFNTQ